MKMKIYRVLILAILLMLFISITIAQEADTLPELVLIDSPGLHPEGVEWDAEGERFLVGSLTMGGIYEIADDGTTSLFIEHEQFISTVGIHIDNATNRLLVANGDLFGSSPEGTAQLGIFDLQTGEELHYVELGDLHDGMSFANDVVNDTDGNAYVTDTVSPVIYIVDIDGNAEVFVESENFAVDGIGLNGIEYHEDGFLIVALHGTGEIYRVPLDNPSAMTSVELAEPTSIDGMVLDEEGHLIAVTGEEILVFSSDDNWTSADVLDRGQAMPEFGQATVALRDGHAFVVHARFTELGSEPPTEMFEILRVAFDMGHNHEMVSNVQEVELTRTPLRIHFSVDELYPEGIAYDEVGERFLVSSLTQGTITAVYYEGSSNDYYDARTEMLVDDEDLVSAVGIHIDSERGRLLVANSDIGVSIRTSEDTQNLLAELAIYDLATGERLHLVDLDDLAPDSAHFANDVAYDANGNVYITDSFSPIIYKVDVDGNAEIFLEHERFTGEGFNLNGIVVHPDGYLIATKFNEGVLFKIPLDEPTAFTEIEMEDTFPGADGIVLMEDGRLFLVGNQLADNSSNQVMVLESDDDWTSATVARRFRMGSGQAPTTATRRGDTVHVLFGRLDFLFATQGSSASITPARNYQIVRADCCFP